MSLKGSFVEADGASWHSREQRRAVPLSIQRNVDLGGNTRWERVRYTPMIVTYENGEDDHRNAFGSGTI